MQIQTIEDKQKFLRTQIYEKGIQPQGFMDFMGGIKGEGENIDLDNWTISQLSKVVQEYKNCLNQSKIDLMQSRISRELKKSTIFIPKKQKFKYEGTNLYDFQQKYDQECPKSQLVFGSINNLVTPKIQIQKYQIKSVGGFIFGIGARNQLQLTISSNFTMRKVMRKDQDCVWLKNILGEKYSGVYVPPLSASQEFSTDDKKGINARIQQITLFLNTLLSYNFFLYSNDFKEFMTQQEHKKFTQHRNKQSNLILQKVIIDIQTPTGLFNVDISEKIHQDVKKSSQITQDLNNLYSQLGVGLSQVINDIDVVAKSIRKYYDLTSQIGQKYNQIQKTLKQQFKLPTIFLSINTSIETIVKNLKQDIKALYALNDSYIKPAVKEFHQLMQAKKKQQTQLNSYLTFKENLLKKKQRFIHDPTKWQLPETDFIRIQRLGKLSKQDSFDVMFPNDNQRENNMRVWLSFVNQNYLKSLKLYFAEHQKLLLQSYITYTQKYLASSIQINQSYEAFRQIVGI